jgi:hypothetical protein
MNEERSQLERLAAPFPNCPKCGRPLSNVDENATRVSRHNQDTARQAAQEALPRSGSQRRLVLNAIATSVDGLTDEEVRLALGIHWTSAGTDTRRKELQDGGWVQNSGRRRKTLSNKDAIVWELTSIGRERLITIGEMAA